MPNDTFSSLSGSPARLSPLYAGPLAALTPPTVTPGPAKGLLAARNPLDPD